MGKPNAEQVRKWCDHWDEVYTNSLSLVQAIGAALEVAALAGDELGLELLHDEYSKASARLFQAREHRVVYVYGHGKKDRMLTGHRPYSDLEGRLSWPGAEALRLKLVSVYKGRHTPPDQNPDYSKIPDLKLYLGMEASEINGALDVQAAMHSDAQERCVRAMAGYKKKMGLFVNRGTIHANSPWHPGAV